MKADKSCLTLESQEISAFIDTHLKRAEVKICIEQRTKLRELFEKYQSVFLHTKAGLKIKMLKNGCPLMETGHFMDPAIAQQLKNQPCYFVQYAFETSTCQFNVFADRSAAELGLQQSAVNLLTIAQLICAKPVHIKVNYFPSDMRKTLPLPGEPLTSKHMNSGATLAYGLGPIDCWREEEHDRTFCHELIHCLRVDFRNIPTSLMKPFYDQMAFDRSGCESGDCKTQILLNEAYTEIHAVLFHCMFVSHRCQSEFFDSLNTELAWSLFQTAKVLHHNRFPDLMSLVDRKSSRSEPWHQTTEVFGYVVVKTSLLHQLGSFLELYKTGKSARAKHFVSSVLKNLLNPALHHDVGKAMTSLSALPSVSKMRQSLRLTALACQA